MARRRRQRLSSLGQATMAHPGDLPPLPARDGFQEFSGANRISQEDFIAQLERAAAHFGMGGDAHMSSEEHAWVDDAAQDRTNDATTPVIRKKTGT